MLLALLLAAVAAAEPAPDAPAPSDAVRDAVAARLGVPAGDVEVSTLVVPGAPAGTTWQVELPGVGPVWGSVPVVLRATTPTGTSRYVVRPYVAVWKDLPVAAAPTAAGAPVPVTTGRVALDRLRGEDPVDPTRPWEARVDLAAGAPLTTARVRPLPDAAEGATVKIVAGAGPLTVAAVGRLDEDAFVGGQVRVVNLTTRTALTGTYQADGTVRVGAF